MSATSTQPEMIVAAAECDVSAIAALLRPIRISGRACDSIGPAELSFASLR
jgi:hypothetical protein